MKITHEAYPGNYGVCTPEQFRDVWAPQGYTEVSDDDAAKLRGPEDVARGNARQDPDTIEGDALREYATTLGVEFSKSISDATLRERVHAALGTEPTTTPGVAPADT